MLGRMYLLFGMLVLLSYALTSYEGWELGVPYQGVPSSGGGFIYTGRSPGGYSSSHTGGYGFGGGK
jgi:hypothetical protein